MKGKKKRFGFLALAITFILGFVIAYVFVEDYSTDLDTTNNLLCDYIEGYLGQHDLIASQYEALRLLDPNYPHITDSFYNNPFLQQSKTLKEFCVENKYLE